MIERFFQQKAPGVDWKVDKQWISFDEISDNMKRAAVAAEEQSFLEHHGFDFRIIEKAIEKMRTVKNSQAAAPYRNK